MLHHLQKLCLVPVQFLILCDRFFRKNLKPGPPIYLTIVGSRDRAVLLGLLGSRVLMARLALPALSLTLLPTPTAFYQKPRQMQRCPKVLGTSRTRDTWTRRVRMTRQTTSCRV
ncbi:uncharacterized protein LOC144903710 [Branchiostoma floridae x Branchiostoma belcheri]